VALLRITDYEFGGYGVGFDEAGQRYRVRYAAKGDLLEVAELEKFDRKKAKKAAAKLAAKQASDQHLSEENEDVDQEVDQENANVTLPTSAKGDCSQATIDAQIIAIIEPGPDRDYEDQVKAKCKFFGECGGCDFGHLSYDAELKMKEQFILDAADDSSREVRDAIRSSLRPIVHREPSRWRRRVSLHVSNFPARLIKEGEMPENRLGFYAKHTRRLVELDSCYISSQGISNGIGVLRQVIGGYAFLAGSVISLDDTGKSGAEVSCVIELLPDKRQFACLEQIGYLVRDLSSFYKVKVFCKKEILAFYVGGKEVLPEDYDAQNFNIMPVAGLEINIAAGGFFQANWEINNQLVGKATEITARLQPKKIYDLFAGTGNFCLPMIKAVPAKLVTVEVDKRTIKALSHTALKFGLDHNLEVHQTSVEKYLRKYLEPDVPRIGDRGFEESLSLLDPPRSGISPFVEKLPRSKDIILVNCYLPSFVSDCKALIGYGYKLKEVYCFDMFPRSTYSEMLSYFTIEE